MAKPLFSPTLDVVFKLLFARKPELLTALLNPILARYGYAEAVSLVVMNPAVNREAVNDKQIFLDIRAIDSSGRQFDVEMQVQSQASYRDRVVYYLARLHAGQLDPGDTYRQLRATLGVHFLNFTNFDAPERWLHCFELRERSDPAHRLSEQFTLWFVELPKARDRLQALLAGATPVDLLDWWLAFFNDPEAVMSVEQQAPEAIRQALDQLRALSAEEQKRQLVEDRKRAILAQQIEAAAQFRDGEQKGRAEGRAEGLTEGERNRAIAIARKMLSRGDSVEVIADLTGLSAAELDPLARPDAADSPDPPDQSH